MKLLNCSLLLLAFAVPMLVNAGEPSKGTIIMISGVSGWMLLCSGFILWKELKRSRKGDDK